VRFVACIQMDVMLLIPLILTVIFAPRHFWQQLACLWPIPNEIALGASPIVSKE
jgi:hypothetical protein